MRLGTFELFRGNRTKLDSLYTSPEKDHTETVPSSNINFLYKISHTIAAIVAF